VRNRLMWFFILCGAGVTPALRGQSVNEVRVYTSAPGASFRVDDQIYSTVAAFLWPAGSKHTITFSPGDQRVLGTQFLYKGWVTNLSPDAGPSSLQPITASAGLQWVRLDFDVEHLLTVTIALSGSGSVQVVEPNNCTILPCWIREGDPVDIRAFPNSGYIFTEWISGAGGVP